jgi:hypothetical protein
MNSNAARGAMTIFLIRERMPEQPERRQWRRNRWRTWNAMDHTLHHHSDSPPPTLWFGVLGAPAAWATQVFLGWYAATVVCDYRSEQTSVWFSAAGLRAIEIGISALAILVAVAALGAGIGAWREALKRENHPATYDFLATIAVFGSLAFLIGIVWSGVPLFMMQPCEGL